MPHRNQKIFDQGWNAWGGDAQNPYPEGTNEHNAWNDGAQAAQEDFEHQEAERNNYEGTDYGDRADFEYDRNR